MLYKKPTRSPKSYRARAFRLLADVAAGVHAASGLAHGIQPPADSGARYANEPE